MYLPYTKAYYDPEEVFFAQTHRRVQRGFDLPENIPATWARLFLKRAVDSDAVPLELFSNYTEPITQREFLSALGQKGGKDIFLQRKEAGVLLNSCLEDRSAAELRYKDTKICFQEEQRAFSALDQMGIMIGTGPDTFLQMHI